MALGPEIVYELLVAPGICAPFLYHCHELIPVSPVELLAVRVYGAMVAGSQTTILYTGEIVMIVSGSTIKLADAVGV